MRRGWAPDVTGPASNYDGIGMTRYQQLKNDARRAEHRSDWTRAIELYKSAIRLSQEAGSVADVGLYNRVGDLYLRRGETASAVEHYEQAVDLYSRHGLHTSAIALCNKILRIAPDRDGVYRQLAKLHAATGLFAEARSAFLRYAERMRARDRLGDSLEALQELIGLTGDEELRSAFANQLAAAGLAAQAVAQLRLVYEARIAGGRNTQDIRERILELDPSSDPVAPPEAPPPRALPTGKAGETETRLPASAGDGGPAELPPHEEPPPAGERTTHESGVEDGPIAGSVPADPDLVSLLARFRSRVREIIEDTDHQVHYDLGLAYMSGGRLAEAVEELRLAMRSPHRVPGAYALLAECTRSIRAVSAPRDGERARPTDSAEAEAAKPGDVGDLAEQMFQARLAQHRIRRASEEGNVEHEAHLDLGRAYEQMGLLVEAVREFVVAVEEPAAVGGSALAALERAASMDSIDAVALRQAIECLLEHGRSESAAEAGRRFIRRTGISEADRQLILELLPTGEEAAGAAGETVTPPEPVRLPEPEDGTPTAAEPPSLFGEAEALRETGRFEEAESLYYRALEMYEGERDAESAIRVIDRLISLRPDDVVLHHQKTELAITTNDREMLVTACLDLASCLRRQSAARAARTVYGRILDVDPRNAEARAGIAALDADELTLERQHRHHLDSPGARPGGETREASAGTSLGEFDELLEDLREDVAVQEPEATDYESHYELGIAFRQMQMWEEAARELRLAVQGLPDPTHAYELLGQSLINLRRYDEARRILAAAAERPEGGEDRSPILYQLGVAHLRAGDREQARQCLERAVSLNSGHAEAARLLSSLSS